MVCTLCYKSTCCQQVHQRELDDNLKLRQKKEEEKSTNEEMSKLTAKIGGMDVKQVIKEKEQLKKKEESVLTKVSVQSNDN